VYDLFRFGAETHPGFTRPLSLLVSARTEVSETADMSRHRRERMSGEYLHCNVCLRDVPRGVWTIFLSAWASLLMLSILFLPSRPQRPSSWPLPPIRTNGIRITGSWFTRLQAGQLPKPWRRSGRHDSD